ncbi:MAG: hypothetical protein GY775_08630 [Candidatus Scalindua sp.]|nr:hypothetical protein [Candidatus Scalindua sp.]
MSSLGFIIVTSAGGLLLLSSIGIYIHSYLHDRKLHNPKILVLFAILGFILVSTPHWDKLQGKAPGGYEAELSRDKQEQEMDTFVSTKKSVVDKLPPGNPIIVVFNNFNKSLQEYHKETDEQKRASMLPRLYDKFIGTSTAVINTTKQYKIIDLTE